jgi:hypothetical protein
VSDNVDIVILKDGSLFWGIVPPDLPHTEEVMNLIETFIDVDTGDIERRGFSKNPFLGKITGIFGHHVLLNEEVLEQTINLLQMGDYSVEVRERVDN